MKSSLTEEFYKFQHQKTPLYGIIALLILMIYGGVGKVDQQIVAMGFGLGQWITIILITIGSAFFAMEYNNHTITTLLYKNSNKLKIYLSKFLIVFLYAIILVIIGALFTFILKTILVGNKFGWTDMYTGSTSLLMALVWTMVGTVVYSLFITTLSFLLIMLLKVNVAVVGVGLGLGFLGVSLSAMLMDAFPQLINLLKWNPLSMLLVSSQLLDQDKYMHASHLTNIQIVSANCIYSLLFLLIGYWLFK